MNFEKLSISFGFFILWILEIACKKATANNLRLFLETTTHAFTGLFFWVCCLLFTWKNPAVQNTRILLSISESCIWAAFGAIIPDIDHFLAAGSLSIERARQLPGRPFLHWGGLYIILYIFMTICSPFIITLNWIIHKYLAVYWIILISMTSHILRDTFHRGLWLWPPPNLRTWLSPSFTHTFELPSLIDALFPLKIILFYPHNFWFTNYKCLRSSSFNHLIVNIVRGVSKSLQHKWLVRQHSDPFVRRAKLESYRCRSAFKLIQLHEKFPGGLFKSGDIVVDCGAAPGSWSQVAISYVNPDLGKSDVKPQGLVIAFDLLDYAQIPGTVCYKNVDLHDWPKCVQLVKETVIKHFGDKYHTKTDGSLRAVDVVLSDLAPNVTGLSVLDTPAIINLANCVLNLAIHVSKPGASLIIKLWQGPEAELFKKTVSQYYPHINHNNYASFTKFMKPSASRTDSSEIYLVAKGFQITSN